MAAVSSDRHSTSTGRHPNRRVARLGVAPQRLLLRLTAAGARVSAPRPIAKLLRQIRRGGTAPNIAFP